MTASVCTCLSNHFTTNSYQSINTTCTVATCNTALVTMEPYFNGYCISYDIQYTCTCIYMYMYMYNYSIRILLTMLALKTTLVVMVIMTKS